MIHPRNCRCDAYACRLRAKGVQLDPGTTRQEYRGKPGNNAQHNSWEAGVAGEHRAGGTFMPYLDRKGNVIPIKQGVDNKFQHRKIRRKQHDRAVAAGHHH